MSKSILCACCNKQIENEYLTVGDNYLQIKYFDEEDGNLDVDESVDELDEFIKGLLG